MTPASGVRAILAKCRGDSVTVRNASLPSIFAPGVITNVLNPKVALFFLAFLPQFISPSGSALTQTVRLGLIFDLSGTTVNIVVALAASSVGDALRRRVDAAPAFRWLTGGVLIGLGVRLART